MGRSLTCSRTPLRCWTETSVGISPFGFGTSGCGCLPCICPKDTPSPPPPNVPDPSKFNILRMKEVGDYWVVVEVMYHEAKNYEGRKIMVYRANSEEIQACDILDPHFCDGKHLSPFARFEPTKAGWAAAMSIATILNKVLPSE